MAGKLPSQLAKIGQETGSESIPKTRLPATTCNAVRGAAMTPWGSELSRIPSGKAGIGDSGGSKSGNIRAGFGSPTPPPTSTPATPAHPAKPTDPELAAIVAAWPNLPPAIRAGIAAMVTASKLGSNP